MQLGINIVEVCTCKEKLHNSAGTSLLLKTKVEAVKKGVSSALQLTTENFLQENTTNICFNKEPKYGNTLLTMVL